MDFKCHFTTGLDYVGCSWVSIPLLTKLACTIEVTNLLNNHMVGDYQNGSAQRRTNTNVNKGPNAWMMPWDEVPLKPSGLIGPMRIRVVSIL